MLIFAMPLISILSMIILRPLVFSFIIIGRNVIRTTVSEFAGCRS